MGWLIQELVKIFEIGITMYSSDRIRFRFPERDDLFHFKKWYNDADVREHLNHSLPMSMANEEKWFEMMLNRPMREQNFLIETKVDGKWTPIGTCALNMFNDIVKSAELGIIIGEKQFWNQGFGTEAMQLLIWHGFANLNLNRIQLSVSAPNKGAIKCYENVGMTYEGRLRQAYFKNGDYVDYLLFSILRNEWKQNEREENGKK